MVDPDRIENLIPAAIASVLSSNNDPKECTSIGVAEITTSYYLGMLYVFGNTNTVVQSA